MKKTLVFLGALLLSGILSAQIVRNGYPLSWNDQELAAEYIAYGSLPGLSQDEVDALSQQEINRKDLPVKFAHAFNVNYNLANNGRWLNLKNGDRVWMMGIESPGALALSLIFNDFYLPEGAKLFIYKPDRSEVLGALTSDNNSFSKLGTSILSGDKIILEYFEPFPARGKGILNIAKVSHAFRLIQSDSRSIGISGQCNIDVDCLIKEEDRNTASSVVMITVDNGTRWATGIMVNNTGNNGQPLLLTGYNSLMGDPGQWVFYFNYNSVECESDFRYSPLGRSMSGATLLTSLEGIEKGHFALLELSSLPPKNWGVHLAGWNRSPNYPEKARCIHHPGGDVKKTSCLSYSPTLLQDMWIVNEWSEGVTEPGSMGGPLLDHNGRLIGILIDGTTVCGGNGSDAFARFDRMWNPESIFQGLKYWLDPSGTGAESLVGIFPEDAYTAGIDVSDGLRMFPVPASSALAFRVNPEFGTAKGYFIYDSRGKQVLAGSSEINEITIAALSSGVYFLEVITDSGIQLRQPFVKE